MVDLPPRAKLSVGKVGFGYVRGHAMHSIGLRLETIWLMQSGQWRAMSQLFRLMPNPKLPIRIWAGPKPLVEGKACGICDGLPAKNTFSHRRDDTARFC